AYERSLVAQVGAYDAVVTPALALTPRPVGWYDAEDPERNFEQQCLYTPFTSMLNVAGLPAVTVPTHWTEPTEDAPAGLPMGVQIVGRPGGEATQLALTHGPVGWYEAEAPVRNYGQQCSYTPFTSMLNVAGLPAVTVPTHWTEPTEDAPAGLPMGVQIVGRPGGEATLLALAAQVEA